MWHLGQAQAGLRYQMRKPLGGRWMVGSDIAADFLKPVQSEIGPDYSPHFGLGSGLSVDKERSHRTTAS